jgi:hypothetical protein
MEYPNNQVRIRDGTVRPITVPQDQLEHLKEVLNSNKFTPSRKETVQKRITGCCCVCGDIPTMQVSYDADGATRIEKYCDKCIKNVFAREAVL